MWARDILERGWQATVRKLSIILKFGEDSHADLTWASLIAQLVKNPPAMQETPVRFLDQEAPREKG